MPIRKTLAGLLAGTLWLTGQSSVGLRNLDLDAIDKSCKPCEDFYQYSIGKWHAANPIPASRTRWGKRWAGADGNEEVLKTILDGLAGQKFASGTNGQLLSDFYAGCMDTAAIEARGAKPIEQYLRIVESITSRERVQPALETLIKSGISLMVGIMPAPYTEDPNQVFAGIGVRGMGLPDRDYYLKDDARSKDIRARYLKHMEALLTLAGVAKGREADVARSVMATETRFATESLTRVERRNPYATANWLSPEKLKELTPHFDWSSYFKATGVVQPSLTRVPDMKQMKEFERMLANDSAEDIRNLFIVQGIRGSARNLSKPFRDEMFAFVDSYLGGAKEQEPRWKQCVGSADNLLGEALGKAYVDKVFPPEAKTKMQEMVKYLQAALKESIEGLEWMTPETKKQALAKLATFDPKVGYPDKWRPYTNLKIEKGNYFESIVRANKFAYNDQLVQIGKPIDRTRWGMTTPTSNAYYNPPKNEIVFPAGILVPPMFDVKADDAANYGGIGVVIGHEISHGFDDQGSQYDAQGRLKNWWTPEDRKRFLERADCVVQQFNGYEIEPGVAHNGKLVLGESIGDLAGARIAYLAYMKSLEGKEKKVVDGFTPEQRFFLAWGQARGDSTRIEQQRLMVVTDPHPVAKYRVIGPLSNMPEFWKAFGCKQGDAMVRPEGKQCRIW